MNILPLKDLTFKDIERDFFKLGCEIARNLMQQFLNRLMKSYQKKEDKTQLRHKGKKQPPLKPLWEKWYSEETSTKSC
ncbi:MAG: hypothetical protein ACOX15_07680 [Tepidanaerobacteraceae bacterium]